MGAGDCKIGSMGPSANWVWNVRRPCEPPSASENEGGPEIEAPFPVYPLLWHPVRTRLDALRTPAGRVVGVEYTYDYQPSEEAFQRALGYNDVVWIPVYKGTLYNPSQTTEDRLPEYDKNERAISEIAPKVRAILIGNANAEIRYNAQTPEEEYEKCLEFVEMHCKFVRQYGRPAFAPIFEILVHDCYKGGGRLRDLFQRYDALLMSFAGCSWLFEQERPWIPEERPFPQLAEYLGSVESWSGVGKLQGLAKGSGEVLKASGYSAGFAGWY